MRKTLRQEPLKWLVNFSRRVNCSLFHSVLGSPCHIPGPCEGISNSLCVPNDVQEAFCRCRPGFIPYNDRSCLPPITVKGKAKKSLLRVLQLVREKVIWRMPSGIGSFRPHSVSLGYPCDSDAQCQSSDLRSICYDGLCTCNSTVHRDTQWIITRLRRRFPRSRHWFCNQNSPRLCPRGTFQVSFEPKDCGKRRTRTVFTKTENSILKRIAAPFDSDWPKFRFWFRICITKPTADKQYQGWSLTTNPKVFWSNQPQTKVSNFFIICNCPTSNTWAF